MSSIPKRLLIFLFVATMAASAAAQELDVFEITDFMDPRLRGTVFDADGVHAKEQGADFRIIRFDAGGVHNYDWRTEPTDENVHFMHVVGSYYSGLRQVNVKFTTLQTSDRSTLPEFRLEGQVARYELATVLTAEHLIQKIAGRWAFSTAIERTRLCIDSGEVGNQTPSGIAHRTCSLHYGGEATAQLDDEFPLPNGRTNAGSLILTVRSTAAEGHVLRATYVSRLADKAYDRLRVGVAFDFSGERARAATHWGAVRLGLSGAVDLFAGVALNAVWTPTYNITERGRRVHNEVALFVDRKLYAKVFPHPPTRTQK